MYKNHVGAGGGGFLLKWSSNSTFWGRTWDADAAGPQTTLLRSGVLDFGWTAANEKGTGAEERDSERGLNGDPYLDC